MTNMTSTVASTNSTATTSAFVVQPASNHSYHHPKPLAVFGSNGKEVANYAVVKLKSSDSLVSLFQLLLQHGYNQVSFVNSLNETIFPFAAKFEKCTQTAVVANSSPSQHLLGPELSLNSLTLQQQRNSDPKRNFPSVAPTTSNFASAMAGVTFEQALNALALDLLPPAARFGSLGGGGGLGSSLPSAAAAAAAAAFLGLPTVPSIFGPPPSTTGTPASSLFPPPTKGFDCLAPPVSSYQAGSSSNSITTSSDVHLALKRKINENAHMLSSSSNGQLLEVPVAAKKAHGGEAVPLSSSVLSALSTATNTQLRQRGQRGGGFLDDPSLYVTCRLCKNRIMGSRISNLTNHVRRHSSLKQFQCCYCEYTHNEMAKVRLHMLHNHKDKDSQPIDNLSPEMQTSWELLMKECFPEQSSQQQQQMLSLAPTVAANNGAGLMANGGLMRRQDVLELPRNNVGYEQRPDSSRSTSKGYAESSPPSDDFPLPDNLTTPTSTGVAGGGDEGSALPCLDCGELVAGKDALAHVYARHLAFLPLFVCSQCGFDDNDRDKLRRHLASEHRTEPGAQVLTRNLELILDQLLPQFFPTGAATTNLAELAEAQKSKRKNEEPETGTGTVSVAGKEGASMLKDSSTDSDANHSSPDDGSLKLEPVDSPKTAVPAVLADEDPPAASIAAAKAPFKCPKCHFTSSSRRRIANHASLRHSLDCSSMF